MSGKHLASTPALATTVEDRSERASSAWGYLFHRIDFVFAVYFFLTCAQELPTTALSLVLVHSLSLDPAEVSSFYGKLFLVWAFKPLYVLISDLRMITFRVRSVNATVGADLYAPTRSHVFHPVVTASANLPARRAPFGVQHSPSEPHGFASSQQSRKGHQADSRRAFLFYCAFVAGICAPLMAFLGTSYNWLTDLAILQSMMACACEAVIDAMSVDLGRKVIRSNLNTAEGERRRINSYMGRNMGNANAAVSRVQSASMMWRTGGSAVSMAISMVLLYFIEDPRITLAVGGLFYLFVCIAVLLWPMDVAEDGIESQDHGASAAATPCTENAVESDQGDWPQHDRVSNSLRNATCRFVSVASTIAGPLVFTFLWNILPTSLDAYSTYIMQELTTVKNWEWSVLKFLNLGGSLAGAALYYWLAPSMEKGRSFRSLFAVSSFATALVGLSYLGPSERWYAGIGARAFVTLNEIFIVGLLGRAALMPAMILAASSCPSNGEFDGLVFALFTSAAHIPSSVSAFLTSRLSVMLHVSADEHWAGLSSLVLICSGLSLVPIAFLWLLPRDRRHLAEKGCDRREGEGDTSQRREIASSDALSASRGVMPDASLPLLT